MVFSSGGCNEVAMFFLQKTVAGKLRCGASTVPFLSTFDSSEADGRIENTVLPKDLRAHEVLDHVLVCFHYFFTVNPNTAIFQKSVDVGL